MTPKLTPGSGTCQCGACGEFFRSDASFVKHRKGDFDHRTCMTPQEMLKKGMSKNKSELWVTSAYPEESPHGND